ncbi:MAG: transcription-repair coupling factor [Moorella humiferrea]|uniref:Transcription-repair-coupling factor n=1 Tax=Neomoorella humiferrea TaxID=676965 RepID=A0A2T0ATW9_9FIRM|nr:transcription-repair coupling factor [Moorella humiferrea]MBE3571414.1 transcription-repair coupling factor [Moorella humiferrea]PRR73891.1 Transcription-repair-coupling factor [Moorella humiferrea]
MYNHYGILQIVRESSQFHSIIKGLEQGLAEQQLYGLPEGLKGVWLAALLADCRPVVCVTAGSDEAGKLAADITSFLTAARVDYFPARELLPLEVYTHSPELSDQRLHVLHHVLTGKIELVIVPVDALLQKLPPPETLKDALISLEVGQTINREVLLEKLVSLGYRRQEVVSAPGHMAVRGGVIDVYPVGSAEPVRLELFGDEIDSLRFFNPETQLSVAETRSVTIGPAREVLPPADIEPGMATLKAEFEEVHAALRRRQPQAARELKQRFEKMAERLEMGDWPEGIEQLQAAFYPRLATLFDYFPRTPLLVFDDPARIFEEIQRREQQRLGIFTEMLTGGMALPLQGQAYMEGHELVHLFSRYQRLYFSILPRRAPGTSPRQLLGVTAQPVPAFQGRMHLLLDELSRWRRQGYRIIFMVPEPERMAGLRQALSEGNIMSQNVNDVATVPEKGQVLFVTGRLHQGFTWPEMGLAVLGDAEIYGGVKRPRRVKPAGEGTKITSFQDLREGDYVVHVHHGIGRYLGLKQLEVGGVKKDYLLIQYAGQDRLYVPVEQISLVQKYVGAEGHVPRLYRLGGNEWHKVKSRVQEAVQAMAEELLDIYAKREAMPGYAFSPDTPWQREFEEAFPYTETPDQLKAIAEVKADMEQPRPMDRLLCGDVGYGKTEVAMRAAFKAVMDGKQVAVLVPTTILAQQHYNTFKGRFENFPVKIAVLSRFSSPAEQKRVIKALKKGEIDIIIGTHRLLSKDVAFKDLGLVIIDEEQRFGVAHKEKLKKLRYSVDVLTMTATPIPRTLHMALAGVRNMSLIETPPEDRFPVQTYVVEYSPELVREAIRRELDRGGQVYFVHNRVMDIDRFAYHVQQLVPEARVAVAHGQMEERELERVMLDFIEGRYDVLVCTTIVENGLDIPNVNTLIVDESDCFGLAQLYQLRGRVGRSSRLAYAYFTYRPDKVLGEVAEKRLAAIREFTALGSGYKIALRDLQIRGAGNLLGPEQHGHMLAVGFDLYCQLLEEAVQKLKRQRGEILLQEKEGPPPASVELHVDTFLSDDYIPDDALKMEFYQRLMAAGDLSQVEAIAEEMEDRFGRPPAAAENLISLSRVRLLAREVGVAGVHQNGREVELHFGHTHNLRGEKLMHLTQHFPRKLTFSSAGGLTIKVRTAGLDQQGLLTLLEDVLTRIKYLVAEAAG